jgi:LacI family transcriptional regulator
MPMRKPARAITIKDIAALLNMSHSTVSRALNDRSSISDTTKHRVRAAADELGYVANLSARMIRGDSAPLVGLIIPDVQNDFYSNIAKELADRCRQAGVRMLLAITEDDPDIEQNEIRALIEARVSGIAITMTSKPQPASLALLREVPFIQLVRRTARLHKPAVCMADERACQEATEHLLSLGHRRIAYVGTSNMISAGRDRVKGFLRAHEVLRMTPLSEGIELVPPRQAYGFDGVSRVLKRRPTALVIGSSELTIGGLRAIGVAGLDVPKAISVVGYGDPVWFELLSPALTAISLPVAALAEAAARLLFVEIENRNQSSAVKADVIRIMPKLVVRGSTMPPHDLKPRAARKRMAI